LPKTICGLHTPANPHTVTEPLAVHHHVVVPPAVGVVVAVAVAVVVAAAVGLVGEVSSLPVAMAVGVVVAAVAGGDVVEAAAALASDALAAVDVPEAPDAGSESALAPMIASPPQTTHEPAPRRETPPRTRSTIVSVDIPAFFGGVGGYWGGGG
jgi:hypothetical protein